MDIFIDYHPLQNKAVLKCQDLPLIREFFSFENQLLFFAKKKGRYNGPTREYLISKTGFFDIPFTLKIVEYLKQKFPEGKIRIADEITKQLYSSRKDYQLTTRLNLTPKDYQLNACLNALKVNRGLIVLPTSAGKTFTAALLIETLLQYEQGRVFIIVPNIQLVEQTYKDFISYGFDSKRISKWSGNNSYQQTQIVIANLQILLSKATDLSVLKDFQFVIVDEVHKIATSTKSRKVITRFFKPQRLYGMTGTLPTEKSKLWALNKIFGNVVFEQKSITLRNKKDISPVSVYVLRVYPQNVPIFSKATLQNPTLGYREEIEYIIENEFRNLIICKLISKLENNTLVLVDRIIHGDKLTNLLKSYTSKDIFYITGSVAIEERETVRNLMESNNDIIVIAIGRIFSTGISINNLHNVVFAHMGKSRTKLIQSIGRSLRLHHSKKKAKIFDIADICLPYNSQHFQERENIYNEEKIPLYFFDIYEEKKLINT